MGPNSANPRRSTDVTPPSSPTPPTTSLQPTFDEAVHDPEYDRISDIEELEKSRLLFIHDPEAVCREAMAADFSEGRLETFVGNPQKELAGTPNQYVSYQVITKVGPGVATSCRITALTYLLAHSPTSSPSRNPSSPSVAASQTSYSYGNSSQKSIRNAPSPRYPTSTRWSMYAETALALTLPSGVHTPYIASSSG
jgi:hypothetical protein